MRAGRELNREAEAGQRRYKARTRLNAVFDNQFMQSYHRSELVAWHFAAKTNQFDGKPIVDVVIEGSPIAIWRINDVFYATSNLCTHEVAALSNGYVDGDCIAATSGALSHSDQRSALTASNRYAFDISNKG